MLYTEVDKEARGAQQSNFRSSHFHLKLNQRLEIQIFMKYSCGEHLAENFIEIVMKFIYISPRFPMYLVSEYAKAHSYGFLVSVCIPNFLHLYLIKFISS